VGLRSKDFGKSNTPFIWDPDGLTLYTTCLEDNHCHSFDGTTILHFSPKQKSLTTKANPNFLPHKIPQK